MKIVNIELLVRAIELLEAYQVGSISPEKLDINTNKLIKDFEKDLIKYLYDIKTIVKEKEKNEFE